MRAVEALLTATSIAQAVLGVRVLARLARTVHGATIVPPPAGWTTRQRVAVIVPVLNEQHRLGPCLDGLLGQGPEVAEMLVVDGGSDDGTPALAQAYAAREPRLRLVEAGPAPAGWNGKIWGLQAGLQQVGPGVDWVLTLDADVRPAPALTRALLAHAEQTSLAALSAATRQEIGGHGEHLLHPAFLATLVYRAGAPGHASRRVDEVQANGQCMLLRRDVLAECGGFVAVRDSVCEDVTLARLLAARGHQVGFYEAGELVWVRMYASAGETWRNWSRSLPLRDQFSGGRWAIGLLEVLLVQALPLPLLAALLLGERQDWRVGVNVTLLAARLGVLAGTRRAYRRPRWSYWLSPVCDLPVALRLWRMGLQRRHSWRGRALVRGGEA